VTLPSLSDPTLLRVRRRSEVLNPMKPLLGRDNPAPEPDTVILPTVTFNVPIFPVPLIPRVVPVACPKKRLVPVAMVNCRFVPVALEKFSPTMVELPVLTIWAILIFVPVASLKFKPTIVELPVVTNCVARRFVPVASEKLSPTIVELPVETREPNEALLVILKAVPAPVRRKEVPVAFVKISS